MSAAPTVVLATGCSSGVGCELARLFDREPFRLVATTRPESVDLLRRGPLARSERVWIRSLDVTNYAKGDQVVRETEERWGAVDILINNAAICYRSVAEDMDPDEEQRQIAVNYLGPMNLIRACLPGMRNRRRGRIVNVSSVGGMMAMPTMASYSASKFALEGASEALWYEMRPWGIGVSLVRPGFVNSRSFEKALRTPKREAAAGRSAYDAHYRRMESFIAALMRRSPSTSASVARKIFRVANRASPPLRTAGTPDAFLFHYLRRLLPRRLYHALLYYGLPGVRQWGPPSERRESKTSP